MSKCSSKFLHAIIILLIFLKYHNKIFLNLHLPTDLLLKKIPATLMASLLYPPLAVKASKSLWRTDQIIRYPGWSWRRLSFGWKLSEKSARKKWMIKHNISMIIKKMNCCRRLVPNLLNSCGFDRFCVRYCVCGGIGYFAQRPWIILLFKWTKKTSWELLLIESATKS